MTPVAVQVEVCLLNPKLKSEAAATGAMDSQHRPPWDAADWQLALEAIVYYRRTAGLNKTTEQHAAALIETIASSGGLRQASSVKRNRRL